jgi:hypothetical protein
LDEAYSLLEKAASDPGNQVAVRRHVWPATNASITGIAVLPFVEAVAPDQVEECFWRSLAMDDRFDGERPPVIDPRYYRLAGMVARYDRAIARSLLDSVRSATAREHYSYEQGGAWALIDPQRGAAKIALFPEKNDLPYYERPRLSAKLQFLREIGYPQRVRWAMTWAVFSFWVPEPEALDAFAFVW